MSDTSTGNYKTLKIIWVVSFFLVLLLAIPAVFFLEHTVQASRLFLASAAGGLILFIPILILLRKPLLAIFPASSAPVAVYIVHTILFSLMCGSLGSITNTLLADKKLICMPALVKEKHSGAKERRTNTITHYMTLEVLGIEDDFQINSQVWYKTQVNSHLELCFRKGLWGYYHIENYRVPADSTGI